ncbi:MAG: tetratricopeptide repeat protein [Planctomycetes bacterium]|nr:tetratricopeptide repeat protein [Planctomycetota bacterium]
MLPGCSEKEVVPSLGARLSGHSRSEDKLWSVVRNNDVINTWVLLSLPYFPDMEAKGVTTAFDEITSRIRKESEDPNTIVRVINRHIYEELQFSTASDGMRSMSALRPDTVMQDRKSNCMGLTLVYLAIAERLNLPIAAKLTAHHIFLCYNDGTREFNIEATNGDLDYSDRSYRSLLSNPKSSPRAYMRKLSKAEVFGIYLTALGTYLGASGRYNEALDALEKAVELFPGSPSTNQNLGLAYKDLGKMKKAEKFMARAGELDPDFWQAHRDMGLLLFRRREFQRATHSYLKAIEAIQAAVMLRSPGMRIEQAQSGTALTAEMLEEQVVGILKDNSVSIKDLYKQAVICFEAEEFDLAHRVLNHALNVDPNHAVIRLALSTVCFRQAKYQDAIKYSQVNGQYPGFYSERMYRPGYLIRELRSCYHELSISYLKLKKYDFAIKAAQKAIEVAGPTPALYHTLGYTYERKGEKAKATEFYKKALQLDPSFKPARWDLSTGKTLPGIQNWVQSRLLAVLANGKGHENLQLSEDDFNRLVTWMDVYAQRLGSFSEHQEEQLRRLRQRMAPLLAE